LAQLLLSGPPARVIAGAGALSASIVSIFTIFFEGGTVDRAQFLAVLVQLSFDTDQLLLTHGFL
jgi:hypothetical protein